jgi:YVTN family beta-propeller protein
MGHQFSRWLLSKHSQAYAVLSTAEAKEIAKLSGIPGEPQEAAVCLGCHATGAEAEEWEKDPTFHIEDGVQCEKCHGPGSEYMTEKIMRDPTKSRKRGLKMPTVRTCRLCHSFKGSHVAVHQHPMLDLEEGLKAIAHPTPGYGLPGSLPQSVPQELAKQARPSYTGTHVCTQCHQSAGRGYQFSRWRLSGHARAYAILATPQAMKLARDEGFASNPQEESACLRCHTTGHGGGPDAFLSSFSVAEGVGCEACHGPGSEHVAMNTEVKPEGSAGADLQAVTQDTCLHCHENAHGKPFDFVEARRRIQHPTAVAQATESPSYKTPVNLALSPSGRELYVVCQASGSVVVVDVEARRTVAEIPVGGLPHAVAFSPDGMHAYVSNRLHDNVSVIEVEARRVVLTIPVGDDPHGLLTDLTGKFLYVLNTAEDSISVVDTVTLEEVKRLAASRNPWSLALSPDGKRMLVTNSLSRFVEFRTPSMSEVTILDVEQAVVDNRLVVPEANLLRGVSWHPSGEFALITLNRTKNLVPMTRLLQGWTITNGLAVLWRGGQIDQVLLDEPNLYFPDPVGVAFTPDGYLALVTSSGSDRVAVIDVSSLLAVVQRATPEERERILPNHFGQSAEFVVTHIPTRNSPRSLLVSPDSKWGFVANALDDSVTVLDLENLEAVERIDLGGPQAITPERFGERLFHSADIAFQRQFSCSSCHPDGHVDGISYDIEADGIGFNPVDNRTLRGIRDTAPFKWTGKNPTLTHQCGPRLAVFFTRTEPFNPEELSALELYISTIPRPPNRHWPVGAPLTPAQFRGKALFERSRTNDGRVIPEDQRCITCHFPPLYTDRSKRDIGTRMWLDSQGEFDVPHLSNIYSTPPYLHNGIADTLEEIWTLYNPDDRHGFTNDLTKDQLNDLIEFLKTL